MNGYLVCERAISRLRQATGAYVQEEFVAAAPAAPPRRVLGGTRVAPRPLRETS